jgi:uncharacterized protein (DUF2267 family)
MHVWLLVETLNAPHVPRWKHSENVLLGGEPKDLASQLPPEIGLHLLRYAGMGERFSLDEFYKRVSEREGEDLPQAVFHARAVIRVLSEAVSGGEINDILAQLPPEFDRFFREAVEGPMPS